MNEIWWIKRLAVICAVFLAALTYVAQIRLGFAAPFPDLDPLGATAAEILEFRTLLGFEGREVFNGTYRPLDFGFIICLTTLILLIAKVLRPRRFWWAIVAFGLVFCAADLTENHRLAALVNAEKHPQAEAFAEQINLATRVKFAALLLAAASMITAWRQEAV